VKQVEAAQEKHLAALDAFDGHAGAYEVQEEVGGENGDGVMGIVQEEDVELVMVDVMADVVVVVAVAVEVVVAVGVAAAAVAAAAAAAEGKMKEEVLW
jgi:hypothetical protein